MYILYSVYCASKEPPRTCIRSSHPSCVPITSSICRDRRMPRGARTTHERNFGSSHKHSARTAKGAHVGIYPPPTWSNCIASANHRDGTAARYSSSRSRADQTGAISSGTFYLSLRRLPDIRRIIWEMKVEPRTLVIPSSFGPQPRSRTALARCLADAGARFAPHPTRGPRIGLVPLGFRYAICDAVTLSRAFGQIRTRNILGTSCVQ